MSDQDYRKLEAYLKSDCPEICVFVSNPQRRYFSVNGVTDARRAMLVKMFPGLVIVVDKQYQAE